MVVRISQLVLLFVAFAALTAGCLEGGVFAGSADVSGQLDTAGADDDSVIHVEADTSVAEVDTAAGVDTAGPACVEGEYLCQDARTVAVCKDGALVEAQRCEGAATCQGGACVGCEPRCEGLSCGDDGCGGSCGSCPDGLECVAGRCECIPECGGLECGSDGCGGWCGGCGEREECVDGQCVCQPRCNNRECGNDGCGGVCGECDDNEECRQGRCRCQPDCDGKECGDDGCGGSCGGCFFGETCDEDTFQCVAPPATYRAVYIEDRWSGLCNSSNTAGADIDAVALFAADGDLVGYFGQVLGDPGTTECVNAHPNPADASGPPSGAFNEDYVSLQGGWVIGRFGYNVTIQPGMTVVVYEYDSSSVGGNPDPYAVYLAQNLPCANQDDKYDTCLSLLTEEGFGTTEVEVPSSAF